MEMKEYLGQAYRLNELIQSNKAELDDLNALKTSLRGIDYSSEKVKSSSSSDASYTKIVHAIADLEHAIKEDTARMLRLKLEIRETISSVQDNEAKLVLKLRYLNFLSWDEVAESISVSQRTAIRIHDNALERMVIKS